MTQFFWLKSEFFDILMASLLFTDNNKLTINILFKIAILPMSRDNPKAKVN